MTEKNNPSKVVEKNFQRLGSEKNPTIEAVINGLFRFDDYQQAKERLEAIRQNFVISAKLPKEEDKENTLKLWIRGYELDEDEEKKGYLGNFALLKIKKLKDEKYTIEAVKQRIAVKYHPQRKRPKRKHPDWGHPCLRIVKNEKSFETLEDAQKILAQLHEEYPNISIPSVNKLFIIIYSKAEKPPVSKYILEVKPDKKGGYYIDHRKNTYKRNQVPEKQSKPEENSQPQGYFSSMVKLGQSNKEQLKKLKEQKKEEDQKLKELAQKQKNPEDD